MLNLSTESRPEALNTMTPLFIQTEDGVQIRVRHYTRGKSRILIVGPGYAQHGGSQVMQTVSKKLADEGRDVLLMDFRGTGESGARFTFGRNEWKDVVAAIKWCRKRYERVEVMGISLGAYSSLRAAVDGDAKPDHLYLVSCPTRFHDVVFKGGMLLFTIRSLLKPDLLFKERYPFFKWTYPFGEKPNAKELAPRLDVPVQFLVGTEDVLVSPKMSEEVYNAVRSSKSWASFEGADHAEFIFESHTASFIAWAAPVAT